MKPVLNTKTSLTARPVLPTREKEAAKLHCYRLAQGKEFSDFMEKALDLRHIGKCLQTNFADTFVFKN